MGLSNYLPTSAIAKPGVCTSSTRPASPYEGQVIYETDTDKTLVWNGSAWVYLSTSTANPPGLELVKTQTIGSAVSSVAVNDAFSASHDAYIITITGGAASTNNVLYLQLGSTTTGYYSVMSYASFSSFNTPGSDGNSNGTNFLYMGSGCADGLSMDVRIQNPFLAKRTFVQGSATNGTSYTGVSSGMLNNATSYTAFTILMNTGTLTGGTIRVYGYKN